MAGRAKRRAKPAFDLVAQPAEVADRIRLASRVLIVALRYQKRLQKRPKGVTTARMIGRAQRDHEKIAKQAEGLKG
jgi:hypothetical protein